MACFLQQSSTYNISCFSVQFPARAHVSKACDVCVLGSVSCKERCWLGKKTSINQSITITVRGREPDVTHWTSWLNQSNGNAFVIYQTSGRCIADVKGILFFASVNAADLLPDYANLAMMTGSMLKSLMPCRQGVVKGLDAAAEQCHPVPGSLQTPLNQHGQRHQVRQATGKFLCQITCRSYGGELPGHVHNVLCQQFVNSSTNQTHALVKSLAINTHCLLCADHNRACTV